MIARTLTEWRELRHGSGAGEIPEPLAARLAAVAAASPLSGRGGEGVLEHRRHSLRARGVVGIVVADGAVLEILPKIDSADGDAAVRKRLVQMIAVALDLRVEAGEIAGHGEQRDTLLEILIRLFVTRLADAVRRGMPRRYIAHEADLPALRGRLDTLRQFTALAASPQHLACRYDALSPDIALNQIMKAAILRLRGVARAEDNRRLLAELSLVYADIAPVPAGALRWDAVVIDRTNERWRGLIELARLLLGDRFQTTTSGGGQGFSLLFEMNMLFEGYIARMLARALAGSGRRVVAQGGRRFCLLHGERGLFQTRPDILVKRGDVVEQVIDTKWKSVTARIDDPKQGVSQGDVYQMMAYARLYDCPRVTLLYPHHAALGGAELHETYRINLSGGADRVEVATIDIGKAAGIADRLRGLCSESAVAHGFAAPSVA